MKATGRFDTRDALEAYVRLQHFRGARQRDIAADAGVSAAVVSDLLQPLKQRQVVYFKKLGNGTDT